MDNKNESSRRRGLGCLVLFAPLNLVLLKILLQIHGIIYRPIPYSSAMNVKIWLLLYSFRELKVSFWVCNQVSIQLGSLPKMMARRQYLNYAYAVLYSEAPFYEIWIIWVGLVTNKHSFSPESHSIPVHKYYYVLTPVPGFTIKSCSIQLQVFENFVFRNKQPGQGIAIATG